MNTARPARLLLWLLAALAGCAAQLPAPNEADALRASTHWPGTTVADLQQGRGLYANHCSSCHSLYQPAAYKPDQWRGFVQEMAERAKLEPLQVSRMVRYLVATSEAPRAR